MCLGFDTKLIQWQVLYSQNKEKTTLVHKNIYFMFIYERAEMSVSERQTKRRRTWTAILTLYLLNPHSDFIFRALLITSLTMLIKATWPPGLCPRHLLLWLPACPVRVETVCLYNIFNAHMFFFRFSVHVIYFHCPLVYTGGISCLEIHN